MLLEKVHVISPHPSCDGPSFMKVIMYSECAHLCDRSEKQMPSQPKEILDLNSNKLAGLIHTAAFPSTVILNHQLWTFAGME